MTRKLIAFVASLALATPVLGAQQAKGAATKVAAQTASKPAAAKSDSTKPDSAKAAAAKKGSGKKGGKSSTKNMTKDSAKGATKKP